MTERQNLPDFDSPPVVEAVLGVEFAPLEGWDVRHFGLFWEWVSGRYPKFEVQPPIATADRAGPHAEIARNLVTSFLAVSGPKIRTWFVDHSETRLLQVQDDRFIHNWRKVLGDEAYPHYEDAIRPAFRSEWGEFCRFLDQYGIKRPSAGMWEVTYVNHLERGREWNGPEDLGLVFPFWEHRPAGGYLPPPTSVSLQMVFPVAAGGQLSVSINPGVRQRDNKEILQFNLTAKGRMESSSADDLLRGFDLGREWVVRGFADLTSGQMHSLWRRKERA